MINKCSNMLLLFCSNTQTVAEVRLIYNTHCCDSLVYSKKKTSIEQTWVISTPVCYLHSSCNLIPVIY